MVIDPNLKSNILKLLKEDEEFRYAVAGLIGLEDLRKGQNELREAVAKLEKAIAKLEESVASLAEEQRKLEKAVASLAGEQRKMKESVASLAEEQRKMKMTLRYAVDYIEEVSILLEDEARSMIEYRLRQREIEMKLDALIRPYAELDIYGSNGNLTIIGEAKTRLAPRHVRELEDKVKMIRKREPELIKGKLVKVIYALWVHPDALKRCKESGIWLNTPNEELTQMGW